LALGLSADAARSSLRFGLGRFNTEEDVDFAVQRVTRAVAELRKLTTPS
jgi:cysteine desulfurase